MGSKLTLVKNAVLTPDVSCCGEHTKNVAVATTPRVQYTPSHPQVTTGNMPYKQSLKLDDSPVPYRNEDPRQKATVLSPRRHRNGNGHQVQLPSIPQSVAPDPRLGIGCRGRAGSESSRDGTDDVHVQGRRRGNRAGDATSQGPAPRHGARTRAGVQQRGHRSL